MTSIVLIDDHPLAVNGIGAWLSSTGRFTITGTAGTLSEAETLLETINPMPDIIILDVSLGTEDGLKFIPTLKEIAANKNLSSPKVLVCSMHEDPFLIQHAFGIGANAYVSKSADISEIITALDSMLAGKNYINPKYHIESRNDPWKKLTARENEIAFLVKQSLSNNQIAKKLGISERTVENHLSHIYEKKGIVSRADLLEL